MFLERLVQPEKEAFLALAREYIQTDQKATAEELALLGQMCRAMGLDPTMQLPARPRAELLAAFASRRSRVCAMLELLGLALVDGEFDARERELVFETASAFGFAEAELQAMARWHDRCRGLLREAEALMREPEHVPPPLPKPKVRARGKPKARQRAARRPARKPAPRRLPAKATRKAAAKPARRRAAKKAGRRARARR
jgi:hypothetical protein